MRIASRSTPGIRCRRNAAATFADGMAVRVPDAQALDIIRRGAARIVEVSEDEIAEAIRILYSDTHTLAEGAGAGAFAALMKERATWQGQRVAVIVSGQNIDRPWMATVLNGGTPPAAVEAIGRRIGRISPRTEGRGISPHAIKQQRNCFDSFRLH